MQLKCASLFILLSFVSVHAQTLSNCRTPPPIGPNVKPGVSGLTLSRDGKTLVVASGDGVIRFLDVKTGELLKTLNGHTNVVYLGVFSFDEKQMVSSSRDRTARIWEVRSGRELQKFEGFRCAVKAAEFSPNGQLLAGGGNDGMLKIWSVAAGFELKSLVHRNSPDIDMAVYDLEFSRDGDKIYAGNGDGTISVWDVSLGKETRVWKAHENTVIKLAFTSDHRLLATFGDSVVKLWDSATLQEVRSLSMIRPAGVNGNSGSLAISPNGKMIAASDVGFDQKTNNYAYVRAMVWNLKTGNKLFTVEDHKFDINGLLFTRDNRFLITGSVDATIKFWDVKTGQLARTITVPVNR